MKQRSAFLLAAPLAAMTALAAAPLSNPGVVFEIQITDYTTSDPAQVARIAVEGPNLRMGVVSGTDAREGEVIFRGDRREMIAIDHEDKTYVVIDEETVKSLSSQMNDAMRQMEEALKDVPPEQRAMMEQMMRGRMGGAMPSAPAPAELRATSERAEQAGYPSQKYEMVREGRVTRVLWVTDWNNIEGREEARTAFEAMAGFVEDLMSGLAQNPLLAGAIPSANPFENLSGMNGFPVVTLEYGTDGSLEGEARLTSSRREDLDPTEFEPPADYSRQTIGR